MESTTLGSVFNDYPTTTLIAASLVVYLIGILIDYQLFTSYWSSRNVPGPRGVPFAGISHKFLSQSFPQVYGEFIKKYGKIFGTYEARNRCLVVADADTIVEVLIKNFSKFSERRTHSEHWVFSKQLINQGGVEWRTNRSLLSPAFTSAKMRLMYPMMKECYNLLDRELDHCASQETKVSVKRLYAELTTTVIAACAFATKVDVFRDKKNPLITALIDIMTPNLPKHFLSIMLPKSFKQLIQFSTINPKSRDFIVNVCQSIQEQRKSMSNSSTEFVDLLQLMLEASSADEKTADNSSNVVDNETHYLLENQVDNKKVWDGVEKSKKKLTQQEITANCLLFFLAGYETTSTLLTHATYLLALHPEIQDKLHQEVTKHVSVDGLDDLQYEQLTSIKYLDAFISETLRLFPATTRLERVAGEDHTFANGLTVEKGTIVQIPILNVHRDEEYFENARQFNPDRFLPENRSRIKAGSYLPFVIGPKNCIGMRFALMEAKMALANIICKYKFIATDETLRIKENFRQGILVSLVDEVTVSIVRRRS